MCALKAHARDLVRAYVLLAHRIAAAAGPAGQGEAADAPPLTPVLPAGVTLSEPRRAPADAIDLEGIELREAPRGGAEMGAREEKAAPATPSAPGGTPPKASTPPSIPPSGAPSGTPGGRGGSSRDSVIVSAAAAADEVASRLRVSIGREGSPTDVARLAVEALHGLAGQLWSCWEHFLNVRAPPPLAAPCLPAE